MAPVTEAAETRKKAKAIIKRETKNEEATADASLGSRDWLDRVTKTRRKRGGQWGQGVEQGERHCVSGMKKMEEWRDLKTNQESRRPGERKR